MPEDLPFVTGPQQNALTKKKLDKAEKEQRSKAKGPNQKAKKLMRAGCNSGSSVSGNSLIAVSEWWSCS